MNLPNPIALPPGAEYLLPRTDLLLCICPVCLNGLNWVHSNEFLALHATCCCITMQASSINKSFGMFLVEVKPANMKNVHWLFRKSPIGEGPPPAKENQQA